MTTICFSEIAVFTRPLTKLCLLLLPLAYAAPTHFSFWLQQAYGSDVLPESSQFTNFQFDTASSSLVQQYGAAGVKTLLPLHDVLFKGGLGKDGGLGLAPGWQDSWAKFDRETARPLIEEGHVIGFFIGDELVWNGLDPRNLSVAVAAVRSSYPRNGNSSDMVLWTNEAGLPMRNGTDHLGHVWNYSRIAAGLDWFSIDSYHVDGPDVEFVNQLVRPFYESYVYPKMNEMQKAVLVPGSFGSLTNDECDLQCYDTMCAIDAAAYALWADSDPRVVAIAPWNWLSCDARPNAPLCVSHLQDLHDELGTVELNLTKAAWRKIGESIVNRTRLR